MYSAETCNMARSLFCIFCTGHQMEATILYFPDQGSLVFKVNSCNNDLLPDHHTVKPELCIRVHQHKVGVGHSVTSENTCLRTPVKILFLLCKEHSSAARPDRQKILCCHWTLASILQDILSESITQKIEALTVHTCDLLCM